MKQSLNSFVNNGGKIIKKTLKIATAIHPDVYNQYLVNTKQIFNNKYLSNLK